MTSTFRPGAIQDILNQVRLLSYPTGRRDISAESVVMAAALSLIEASHPGKTNAKDNFETLRKAVTAVLGDRATNVRLIWPEAGQPFDTTSHVTIAVRW